MSQSLSSKSQPLPTPTPGAVSQGLELEASSSQGDFYPQVQDGRLPRALLDRPVQSSLVPGATPPVYARGAQPVPQPPSSARYQPQPLEAPEHLTMSQAQATVASVVGGSTSTPQLDNATHLAMAKALVKKPGFADIPMDILLQVVPGLIETIGKKASGRNNNSVGDGCVGTSEALGIISNPMVVGERSGLPDMGLPAIEAPPIQLAELPRTVQPEQLPLVEQLQSMPTIRVDNDSSMGFSAETPMIQFPEYSSTVQAAGGNVGLALPTHEDLEGPPYTVPNSQGSSIELGREEIMDEARTASQILDEILHDGLVGYI
jgi:hypothetical protein